MKTVLVVALILGIVANLIGAYFKLVHYPFGNQIVFGGAALSLVSGIILLWKTIAKSKSHG